MTGSASSWIGVAVAVEKSAVLDPLEVGLLGAEAVARAVDEVAEVAEQPIAADDLVGIGRSVPVVDWYDRWSPERHRSIPTFPDVDRIIDGRRQAGKEEAWRR